MTGAEAIRRRLDKLDQSGDVRVYIVDSDERDPLRLPDGPEVRAEIDAIRAADPRALVSNSVLGDSRQEAP